MYGPYMDCLHGHPASAAFSAEEVDSDGEEVQLCCQCGLPVGETAYRPEEKARCLNARSQEC